MAAGLRRLGVDARYRPRNDIEVDGRKISGTGGFFDGDTLIYQGTVLVDMDPAAMVAALRVPRAKLEKRAARLGRAAGRHPARTARIGDARLAGHPARAARGLRRAIRPGLELGAADCGRGDPCREHYRDEIGTDEFVAQIDDPASDGDFAIGTQTGAGGTLTTYVRLEGVARKRIGQVLITGDFFVAPPRMVFDLEAALRGVYVADAGAIMERFFRERPINALERHGRRFPGIARRRAGCRQCPAPVKTLAVVQHTSAEYLGLIEDHLEGRRIRFRYARPFATGGRVPGPDALDDGLVLLGGGPWGSAGVRDVPTLAQEIALTRRRWTRACRSSASGWARRSWPSRPAEVLRRRPSSSR